MSHLRNLARRAVFDDTPWLVRVALLAAALCVLALGVVQLPGTATTQGEFAIGLLLSVAVAAQLLVAALFFPAGVRRVP